MIIKHSYRILNQPDIMDACRIILQPNKCTFKRLHKTTIKWCRGAILNRLFLASFHNNDNFVVGCQGG